MRHSLAVRGILNACLFTRTLLGRTGFCNSMLSARSKRAKSKGLAANRLRLLLDVSTETPAHCRCA